jgi:hypothetical protein
LLLPALAFVALLLAPPAPATASGDGWCVVDPVVKINGKVVDIVIASGGEADTLATEPTALVITVPVGISTQLLATDKGFGGLGYVVSFAWSPELEATADSLPVEFAVYVPMADGALPVRVDVRPRSSPLTPGSAEGTANAWVTVATS